MHEFTEPATVRIPSITRDRGAERCLACICAISAMISEVMKKREIGFPLRYAPGTTVSPLRLPSSAIPADQMVNGYWFWMLDYYIRGNSAVNKTTRTPPSLRGVPLPHDVSSMEAGRRSNLILTHHFIVRAESNLASSAL
jgi:hypothetical protein